MNTKYDMVADALYMRFNTGKVAKTLRLENHLIVDLDSKSNVLGIELLNAKSQLAPKLVKEFVANATVGRVLA
jgi:uncharacterized protein YuzE